MMENSNLSPEDYLLSEPDSFEKREYIEGIVYTLTNFTVIHNMISGNVLGELHNRLRGKKGDVFPSLTKIRLRMLNGKTRFYYPDVQIVYESNPMDDVFQDKPVLVVEVTSPSTWRTNHVEKLEAYTTIPTLEWSLLVDTKRCEVLVYHRESDGFNSLRLTNLDDKITLKSLGIELPLADIYADVVFPPPEVPDAQE